MTKNDKVLEFPKSKIVRETQADNEKLESIKKKGTKKFADAVSGELMDILHHELTNCGIDTEAETYIKDFAYLNAILVAMVYRALDLEHPLQELIDSSVTLEKIDPEKLDLLDD